MLRKKNHVITLVDGEKAFDKIQDPFMIFKKLKRNTYTEKSNSVGRGTSTANIVLLNRKDFFPHKVNNKAKIICSHH